MKRIVAALLASVLPLAALAQAPDCTSRRSIASAQADIDEVLAAVGKDQPMSRLEARVTALGWSHERRSASLKSAFSSREFVALEKEKRPHVLALAEAVRASSGPEPRTSKCEAAKQVKSIARRINELNARQYDHAAREIGLTESALK
jgi:hypothetical protein